MQTTHKKNFISSRLESFRHAFRGIYVFLKRTPNSWIQVLAGAVLIYLGTRFSISEGEWLALFISIFMLLMAEAFNTAIEVHMDLTSPELHPAAKDTKDIAAGAVLLAAMLIAIIALVIFVPHFMK